MGHHSVTYSPTGNTTASERASEIDGWNVHLARKIARSDGLELTREHTDVLYFLRNYYILNGWPRKTNELTQLLGRQFEDIGGNRALYRLFPHGPLEQGVRLAGLPPLPNVADESFGTVH